MRATCEGPLGCTLRARGRLQRLKARYYGGAHLRGSGTARERRQAHSDFALTEEEGGGTCWCARLGVEWGMGGHLLIRTAGLVALVSPLPLGRDHLCLTRAVSFFSEQLAVEGWLTVDG